MTIVKFWGILLFKVRPKYNQLTTINKHLLTGIRHNIYIQCHGLDFDQQFSVKYIPKLPLLERFPQNGPAVLGATGMYGLK